MCRYKKSRSQRERRVTLVVLALPAAEVGSRELVTVTESHLGHTCRVASALLHLTADVVVAIGPGHKCLQLFHGHWDPPEGFFTANQPEPELLNPSVFLRQGTRSQINSPGV